MFPEDLGRHRRGILFRIFAYGVQRYIIKMIIKQKKRLFLFLTDEKYTNMFQMPVFCDLTWERLSNLSYNHLYFFKNLLGHCDIGDRSEQIHTQTLIPQVIEELRKLGREDIMVIASGVIPAQDYDFLYKAFLATLRMNAQDEHGAPP